MVTQNTTLHSSRPGSLIHLLAEETWDRCWSLADQSDLPNLTLVCSQFRRICQEKLFRHLAIMHRAYPDRIPPHGTPLKFKKAQISRWIKRTREIESWPLSTSVKELSFMNYLTPPMGMLPELLDLHTQFLRTFGEALGAFSNLTQLRLSDIEINRTIYRNLTSLVKLQSVELFSCPISSDCFPRQVLELKKLSIIAPPEDTDTGASIAAGNFSLVNLKTLEELDLTFDVHGGIDFLRAVAAIVPNPGETRLQALTNLEITWDSWLAECLPLILEECPQLESLDIGAYEADLLTPAVDTAALELSSTLIPHLRKLRCMAEHVPILAPGRPVTQVRISSGYDKDGRFSRQNTDMQALAAAVDALSRTSAPVVELDLDPELLSSPRMLPSIFRAVQALNDLDILTFTISEPHWFLLRLIRTNLGSEEEQIQKWCEWMEIGISEATGVQFFMNLLREGHLQLPQALRILNFNQTSLPNIEPLPFEIDKQRAAIIDLEAHLPKLKEVEFCSYGGRWVRDHHIWPSELVERGEWAQNVISQVWKEDGTRRTEKFA